MAGKEKTVWKLILFSVSVLVFLIIFIQCRKTKPVPHINEIDSLRESIDSIQINVDAINDSLKHLNVDYDSQFNVILHQSVDSDLWFFTDYLSKTSGRFPSIDNNKSAEAN